MSDALQKQNSLTVASGTSYGALANDEHAKIAVEQALSKMSNGAEIAPGDVGSVLLFLTAAYAHNPQPAITLAAKAAGTPQVFGCCAMSLLSDQEWLLDVEGAVAMVFPREYSLQPAQLMRQQGLSPELLITLTTPNAAAIAVNTQTIPQMGAITTDEYGHGPFAVWQSGRIVEREFTHAGFSSALRSATGVAEGVRQISPIFQVNRSNKHCLTEINQQTALDNLLAHLPENLHSVGLQQPYNLLCAISENAQVESIEQGHYKLQHIVSINEDTREIHLSGSVRAGRHIFWALRDEQLAQQNMQAGLEQCRDALKGNAKFALMFPNIGRGPEFFNGCDRDLELFQEIFPGIPMIGFYGNGEIAPGHALAGLIHRYSTVFTVFS